MKSIKEIIKNVLKSEREEEKDDFKYLRLTPFESHDAALIISPKGIVEEYEQARELLHQGYKEGSVWGIFKTLPELKNLVGIGVKIKSQVFIFLSSPDYNTQGEILRNKLTDLA